MASAFNVAGPELIRSRVRVNPSEQQQEADQQEGHGRGRKEREKREEAKGRRKGRVPVCQAGPRLENTGGGRAERDGREEEREGEGGKGWSRREPKNAALDPEILGQPPRRRTTIPGVRGPTTT